LLHNIEYTNKLAALGRLAAGTAHEINNPLAIISEKAGLLRDLFTFAESPPSAAKATQLAESIQQSVDRCSTITHRLLGFAKHMDVQNDTLDLQALIQEVLGFHGKAAAHRNIRVDVRGGDEPLLIESDRGQLQQVFLNLINNAFEAVPDGGRIEIAMRRAGPDAVVIAVTDNGVGIPRENLGKVFEPFFTTKKGYGTGLGLSITYGIVQKLGGHIRVASEVGRQTCFTVTLPVSRSR
jgi:two-component system NtrC family sensor kinase